MKNIIMLLIIAFALFGGVQAVEARPSNQPCRCAVDGCKKCPKCGGCRCGAKDCKCKKCTCKKAPPFRKRGQR